MREYLIRPQDSSQWLMIRSDHLPHVLTPAGWDVDVVPGEGDLCVRIAGVDITFSCEDVGWQVTFSGQIQPIIADAIVSTVATQVEQATSQPTRWVDLTGADQR